MAENADFEWPILLVRFAIPLKYGSFNLGLEKTVKYFTNKTSPA
jgi:hypothetical protein